MNRERVVGDVKGSLLPDESSFRVVDGRIELDRETKIENQHGEGAQRIAADLSSAADTAEPTDVVPPELRWLPVMEKKPSHGFERDFERDSNQIVFHRSAGSPGW